MTGTSPPRPLAGTAPSRLFRTGALGAAALAISLLLPGLRPEARAGDPGESAADPAKTGSAADREGIRALLLAGKRPAALEAARKSLAAHPDDIEAHVLYQEAARGQVPPASLVLEYKARLDRQPDGAAAFLLSRLLQPAEAERTLREALKTDARSYWAHVGLATVMARLGKAAPAESFAREAMTLRPGDAAAAARAGAQCAVARRFDAAVACYRSALETAPGDTGARIGLAHALLRKGEKGEVDEAASIAASLAERGKTDTRIHFLVAALAMEKGDLAAAERELVQVVTVAPGDMDAVLQLALLRLHKAEAAARAAAGAGAGAPPEKAGGAGDGRGAADPGPEAGKDAAKRAPGLVDPRAVAAELADLARVASEVPERADVRYAQGFAHEISGNFDEAQAAYREASRLDPLDADVLASLGALLLGRGHVEAGMREVQRALDRDSKHAEALFHLGYGHDLLGDPKEAAEAYEKLLKVDPKDARGWHALGLAQEAAGRAAPALKSLQKAVEIAPGTARYQRDLGEALYGARKFDRAEEALEKATSLDPRDDFAWAALARARTPQRKYAAAAEAYEKAAEIRSADKDLRLLLGAYYQEYLQEFQKALDHYNRYLALGGEADDVQDWMDECEAELQKKK